MKIIALITALLLGTQAIQAQTTTPTTSAVPTAADSALFRRLNWHFALLDKYRNLDVDFWIMEYAKSSLGMVAKLHPQLVAGLPAADRAKFNKKLLLAYTGMADVYGGRMQMDSVFWAIDEGKKALANDTLAIKRLNGYTNRYGLIGKSAPQVIAQHWLVADSITPAVAKGSTTLDLKGKVTILDFTAHWCPSCMNSYPAFRRVYNQYARFGLQLVMLTETYGEFKGEDVKNPLDEIAMDSAYYFTEKKLPATIGIYVPAPVKEGEKKNVPNIKNYHVYGIPQMMIVDKEGIIRYIATGWDSATEGYMEKVIEKYLK